MWQGLSKRQAYKAVTITAVQLLGPCWVLAFLLIFTEPNVSEATVAVIFATWFLVGLVVDGISLSVARRRLTSHFRSVAAQRYDKPD